MFKREFIVLKLRKGIRLESLGLPFKKALVRAAEMGADAVEINARTEIRPADLSRTGVRQIKKLLTDYQLSVCCVNFPSRRGYSTIDDLEQRVDATKDTMTMAWDLGCQVVSNRIGKIPSSESPAHPHLIQALEDLGRHSSHTGTVFAARTGDDEGAVLADLIKSLSPGALQIDFDPAELMLNRHEVQPAMDCLADNVAYFRARDAVRDLSRSDTVEVPLGRGSVDLPPLLAKLEEKNYLGYISVQCPASPDAALQMGQALEYLTHIFG